MPVTVADFLADPACLQALLPPAEQCVDCGVIIQETVTGRNETGRGVLCSDDYFAALGEELEDHPIASGAVRRG